MENFTLKEIDEPKPTKRECKPCEQKGSYLGRTDVGWRMKKDRHKSHSCELLDRGLCNREFEFKTSAGTGTHLEKNLKSTFGGCKSLDQVLLEEGLFSIDPSRNEVITPDPLVLSPGRDEEDPMIVPETDMLLKTEKAALYFLNDLDKKKSDYDNKAYAERHPSPETPLSSLFGPRPESLEHVHFRFLLEKGYFERIKARTEPERERLKFVAQLLVRGFWEIKVVNKVFPEAHIKDFEVLKRKIAWHVKETLPEKVERFEVFWAELTKKQKEAFWLYYMRNPHKRSKEFVASKIGVSVDSLKDRLENATKRLKVAFPELTLILEKMNQEPPKGASIDPWDVVAPVKVFTKEEIVALEEERKRNPPREKYKGLNLRFKSYEEFKAWEIKNAWYPSVSGVL